MRITYNDASYTGPQFGKLAGPKRAPGLVIAQGPGISEEDEAFAFDSEEALIRWSKTVPAGRRVAALYKAIGRARKEPMSETDYLRDRQISKTERVESDLRALAVETGLDYPSEELFRVATMKEPLTRGQIFDPAWLFTGPVFTGASLPAGIPLTDLRFFRGFDNAVSSLMVFGFCVLFAGPLFTGPSRLFLSAPFLPAAIPMLAPFGFDNVTSSVFV